MDIKRLLFVTKFEELWFDALQSLLDLRKAALNHVVFLNVIGVLDWLAGLYASFLAYMGLN